MSSSSSKDPVTEDPSVLSAEEEKAAAEEEPVDLGYMMGILNRHQLEMVLVKFIMQHPESDHLLLDVCRTLKVHESELLQEMPFDETTLPLEVIVAVEESINRAQKFLLAREEVNGLVLLNFATRALADALRNPLATEMEIPGQLEEETEEISSTLQRWEELWETAMTILGDRAKSNPEEKTKKELEQWFQTLAAWRVELQPRFGPIFSDPLRMIKKALKSFGDAPGFAAKSSQVRGKRRKEGLQDNPGEQKRAKKK